MKKTGMYLIFGGLAVLILAFISRILAFVVDHPIIGLALLAVLAGVIILLVNVYKETSQDANNEPFRDLEK